MIRIVYDFYQAERKETKEKEPFPSHHLDTISVIKGHVIKMTFPENPGKERNRKFEGHNIQPGYHNYFIGNDSTKWASFVKLFGEVYIENVAEDIDMRLYFDNGRFRYDFIAKPHADLNLLTIKTEGANGISISENGELVFGTSLGDVISNHLVAYQLENNSKTIINCSFGLSGKDHFGFEAGNYDRNKVLIIDPVVYSTFLGGGKADMPGDIVADNNGESYITGYTLSPNFPVSSGAYLTNFPSTNAYMVFVTKLTFDLSSLVFSTYLGGTFADFGMGISLDANKNIVVSGQTYSNDFPITAFAGQKTLKGKSDCFISKLNTSGSALIFSTFFGGSSNDYASNIILDKLGNIWIGGTTSSIDFPVTPLAFQKTYKSGSVSSDGFISKLNSFGSGLFFSSYVGGTSFLDYVYGIAMDKSGNVYVAGVAGDTDLMTTSGCFQSSTSVLNKNGFVAKISSTYNLVYMTYLGTYWTQINGIQADQYGCAYVTGLTMSPDFPITSNAFQKTINGNGNYLDCFVTKLNPAGSALVYSTFLGGNESEWYSRISIDTFGHAIISGSTFSNDFPVTPNALQKSPAYPHLFFTILNKDGSSLLYSSYLGSDTNDYYYWNDEAMCSNFLDDHNFLYMTGTTKYTVFPVSMNAFQKYNAGGDFDAFVSKINIAFKNIWTRNIPGAPFCLGDSLLVPFDVDTSFWSPNVFIAQLSDSNGSFYNPVNIGSLKDTVSGTIKAVLPKSLPYATHYKIRVIGTAPYVEGSPDSNWISVYPLPSVSFNDGSLVQCAVNKRFIFSNSSSVSVGKIDHFEWQFGDHAPNSNLVNPVHTYSDSGKYKVTLTAISDNGCVDSSARFIYIYKKPRAVFSVSDSAQCLKNNTFLFKNSSVSFNGKINYDWHFGDSNSSANLNPDHSYFFSDTFQVKLIITDSIGCKDTSAKFAYVWSSPEAGFTINDTIQCLKNNLFILNDTSTLVGSNFSSFEWDFGDLTTATGRFVNHSYQSANTFKATLIVTSDKNCKDTTSQNLFVLPNPDAGFIINDSAQCMDGNSFIFTISQQPLVTFRQWEFGDGTFDTSRMVAHSYLTTDTFAVKLLLQNQNGCTDSNQKTVLVFPSPLTDFSVDNSKQCLKNNLFRFTNLSDKNATYFDWFFGDNHTDTVFEPSHSYDSAGFYDVLLIASTTNNCIDSFSRKITVMSNPQAPWVSSNSPLCEGDDLNLTTGIMGNTNYFWTSDFGFKSNLPCPVISKAGFSDSGYYYLKINLWGCESDSTAIKIRVNPLPHLDLGLKRNICYGEKIILDPSDFMAYRWQDNSTNRTFSVSLPGVYSVQVTNAYSCKNSDSIEITHNCPTVLFVPDAFSPNNDGINDQFVIVADNMKNFEIRIFDRWGEIVFQSDHIQTTWDGTFKGVLCPIGVYYYELLTLDSNGKVSKAQGMVTLIR